jgi:hypothetical protein
VAILGDLYFGGIAMCFVLGEVMELVVTIRRNLVGAMEVGEGKGGNVSRWMLTDSSELGLVQLSKCDTFDSPGHEVDQIPRRELKRNKEQTRLRFLCLTNPRLGRPSLHTAFPVPGL